MFIFDHFKLILGCLTVTWPFLGINMFDTLYLDNQYELNKGKCLVGKRL